MDNDVGLYLLLLPTDSSVVLTLLYTRGPLRCRRQVLYAMLRYSLVLVLSLQPISIVASCRH